MDAVKSEGTRKAAPAAVDGTLRPPLVPSEKNNAAPAPDSAGRRREVASRLKPGVPPAAAVPTATRRCASPCLTRASAVESMAPQPKRAQSADRRRSSTPSTPPARSITPSRTATRVRDAAAAELQGASRRATSANAPDGFRASARNLSPSFQPDSAAAATAKKSLDQAKLQRSVSMSERKRRPLRGRNISNECENARPSDTPSRRSVEVQHRWPAMMTGRNPPSAPDQPVNEMVKRLAMYRSRGDDKAESCSGASSQTSESSKSAARRASRALPSPVPALHRSSSPSKVLSAASSTSRAFQSPSRMRPCKSGLPQAASPTGQPGVVPQPVFSYILDARKGKKNASQIESIHQLRLLYNRFLQWHFVNARSEDTLSLQKNNIESILYSVWKSILKLCEAVTVRTVDVQHLRQELKLYSILKEQIAYLEQWPALEVGSSNTLAGAVEVLQASTLRLPVTSGAQADAVAVKNAVSSAVDVMQALNSSICYLSLKVEDRACLFSELSVMARQEKATLDECRELLAAAAKLQVQESSLRTHLMQGREGVIG